MSDKVIFQVHKTEPITGEMLRLNRKTKNYINELRKVTGLPAIVIVEKALEFAVENYEIQEV